MWTLPLDTLEGAARHVHDATCWPGNHAHQTLPDAFKEPGRALLLRTCDRLDVQLNIS